MSIIGYFLVTVQPAPNIALFNPTSATFFSTFSLFFLLFSLLNNLLKQKLIQKSYYTLDMNQHKTLQ